jgi:hypothetical protein
MSIIDDALKANHDPVRGFVFDMETGLLSEVDAVSKQPAR